MFERIAYTVIFVLSIQENGREVREHFSYGSDNMNARVYIYIYIYICRKMTYSTWGEISKQPQLLHNLQCFFQALKIFNQPSNFILEFLPFKCFYFFFSLYQKNLGFPGGSDGKESTCNMEDPNSILGSGRSPGGGHDYPLQYSCLENLHGQRNLLGYNP